MGKYALIWLRRDLRLSDQPAIQAALTSGLAPVFLYIHDEPANQWPLGSASAWWLHHSLQSLDSELRARGTRLHVQAGDSEVVLLRWIERLGASHVFWNRFYEPAAVARDRGIKQRLRDRGLAVHSFNASLLREPWELRKADGDPYRVFTPFWKACLNAAAPKRPLPAPGRVEAPRQLPPSDALPDWALLPTAPDWWPRQRAIIIFS